MQELLYNINTWSTVLLLFFLLGIVVVWFFVPFAIYGTKSLLRRSNQLQRELLTELQRLNVAMESLSAQSRRLNDRPANDQIETPLPHNGVRRANRMLKIKPGERPSSVMSLFDGN